MHAYPLPHPPYPALEASGAGLIAVSLDLTFTKRDPINVTVAAGEGSFEAANRIVNEHNLPKLYEADGDTLRSENTVSQLDAFIKNARSAL